MTLLKGDVSVFPPWVGVDFGFQNIQSRNDLGPRLFNLDDLIDALMTNDYQQRLATAGS